MSIRRIEVPEFVRRLHADANDGKHHALFLGAGCSVSSGIPSAGTLVSDRWLGRLRDLRAPERTNLEAWAREEVPGYDSRNPARSYGVVLDQLFLTSQDRQREIEGLCAGAEPSFGYAALAQLIAANAEVFNVVLTTNFDDLLSDALYLFTTSRPLVIPHESLATFIRSTQTRPLVVKLHGDSRLAPKNLASETELLERELHRQTTMVLRDRGLVFMGYGGEDQGVLELLDALPEEALPQGVYWVNPKAPEGRMAKWLTKRGAAWVKEGWFDEVMLFMWLKFNLKHPSRGRVDRIFHNYIKTFTRLYEGIDEKALRRGGLTELQGAASAVRAALPDSWRYLALAMRQEKQAPEKAQAIYIEGLRHFPNNVPLLGSYAMFLSGVLKDDESAERHFRMGLDSGEENEFHLANYAGFLLERRGDKEGAERLFRRAVEKAPDNPEIVASLAAFQHWIRGDASSAELGLKRALALNPNSPLALSEYAHLLAQQGKDPDLTEMMFKRALEVPGGRDDIVQGYAQFLATQRKDGARAIAVYRQAVKQRPTDLRLRLDMADFLADKLGDFATADDEYRSIAGAGADPTLLAKLGHRLSTRDGRAAVECYLGVLRKDPCNSTAWSELVHLLPSRGEARPEIAALLNKALSACRSNPEVLFAAALVNQHVLTDFPVAESLYLQAIEAQPHRVDLLTCFAVFCYEALRQVDRADAIFQEARALPTLPALTLVAYARFCLRAKGDVTRAAQHFGEAVTMEPRNGRMLADYATFLATDLKDRAGAEAMYNRAVDLAPGHPGVLVAYASFLATERDNIPLAEQLLLRALALSPQLGAALKCYATLLWHGKRDIARAKQMLIKALRAAPDDVDLLLDAANFYAEEDEDLDSSERYLKSAVLHDKHSSRAHVAYARFRYYVRGDASSASHLMAEARTLHPDDATLASLHASLLLHGLDDRDAAEAIFAESLKRGTQDASLLCEYAEFMAKIREDDATAEALFRSALERDPSHAASLYEYAHLLAGRGDLATAEQLHLRAMQAHPKDSYTRANYGLFLLHSRNDVQEAALHLTAAATLEGTTSKLHRCIGAFLEEHAKDSVGAEAAFRRALQVDAKDARSLLSLGIFLLRQGSDEGFRLLRAAQSTPHPRIRSASLGAAFALLIYSRAADRPAWMSVLKQRLLAGDKCPDLDFGPDLRRLTDAGDPYAARLAQLFSVVAGREALTSLEDWPDWSQTKPAAQARTHIANALGQASE